MAVAYQGFQLNKNLEESIQDRNSLNNIAGSPIGSDLALFFNNKRNTSSITVLDSYRRNPSGVIWSTITVAGAVSVFSNKTKLTIEGDTYYVKNSNGVDQFQLSTSADLSTTVSQPPIGTYVRSDEVTYNNIANYAPPLDRRFTTIEWATSSSYDYDPTKFLYRYTSGLENNQLLLTSIITDVDTYNYRTQKSLNIKDDFRSNKVIAIGGAVVVKDIDGQNLSGLTSAKPGVFIYDAYGSPPSITRAFSTNDNPWLTPALPVLLTNITGGSGYANGTYTGVPLIPVSGTATSNPTANITVSGNVVTQVNLTSTGSGYIPFTKFTTLSGNIGGPGAGFEVPVGRYLETTQPNINIGNLVINNSTNGVSIELKNSSMKQNISGTINDLNFTHKLPVMVNGEQFYLCLKLN